jgi:integrase
MPLRVIYRRALNRDEVTVNPTLGLELPAVRGKRERTAEPEEMARLLDALPEADRALWATAMYAGLRMGELQALRFHDLDLARDPCPVIRVERSWDAQEGIVAPKSEAGVRTVPVVDSCAGTCSPTGSASAGTRATSSAARRRRRSATRAP